MAAGRSATHPWRSLPGGWRLAAGRPVLVPRDQRSHDQARSPKIRFDHLVYLLCSVLLCSILKIERSPGLAGGRSGGRATASGAENHAGGRPGLVALRGRVPTLARLAGCVRPGLRPAAPHQPAHRCACGRCHGSPRSNQANRGTRCPDGISPLELGSSAFRKLVRQAASLRLPAITTWRSCAFQV
jgi:hypothetical protein